MDQLLENNKSDECEVDNQFLSERNIEIVEDCNKADDTETTDCHIKLENETCDNNSDDLSGFETEDLNDSSNTLIQSENSDKAIDMIDQKGLLCNVYFSFLEYCDILCYVIFFH